MRLATKRVANSPSWEAATGAPFSPPGAPRPKEKGFSFTGFCAEGGYPEAFEMKDHPFYIGVIFHPEFVSRPNKAHPLFTAFIGAAMK